MTAEQKVEILKEVKCSCLSKEVTLKRIGIAPSTYYRGVRRQSIWEFWAAKSRETIGFDFQVYNPASG